MPTFDNLREKKPLINLVGNGGLEELAFSPFPTMFLCPSIMDLVHIVFILSVFLSVCLQKKPFNIGHDFLMVSDRAFIFHMRIPCGKTFSLVTRSRSSIKVKVEF